MKLIGIGLALLMIALAISSSGLLRSLAELGAFIALGMVAYQIKSARFGCQKSRTMNSSSD